jgi:hypothetical protein
MSIINCLSYIEIISIYDGTLLWLISGCYCTFKCCSTLLYVWLNTKQKMLHMWTRDLPSIGSYLLCAILHTHECLFRRVLSGFAHDILFLVESLLGNVVYLSCSDRVWLQGIEEFDVKTNEKWRKLTLSLCLYVY